jgi:hypothetical protein
MGRQMQKHLTEFPSEIIRRKKTKIMADHIASCTTKVQKPYCKFQTRKLYQITKDQHYIVMVNCDIPNTTKPKMKIFDHTELTNK